MKTRVEAVDVLSQGAGAGQLRSVEEKVLVPLQDERQRWDGRAGPVRVPRVCQEGTFLTVDVWSRRLPFLLAQFQHQRTLKSEPRLW